MTYPGSPCHKVTLEFRPQDPCTTAHFTTLDCLHVSMFLCTNHYFVAKREFHWITGGKSWMKTDFYQLSDCSLTALVFSPLSTLALGDFYLHSNFDESQICIFYLVSPSFRLLDPDFHWSFEYPLGYPLGISNSLSQQHTPPFYTNLYYRSNDWKL